MMSKQKTKNTNSYPEDIQARVNENIYKHIPFSKVFSLIDDNITKKTLESHIIDKNGVLYDVRNEDNVIQGSNFGFGEVAKIVSQRSVVFKESQKCICCGIEGTYFKKKEAYNPRNNWLSFHINLFAEFDGKEIMLTKDHKVPKSRGGKNTIENYATCCHDCNKFKQNAELTWDELRKLIMTASDAEIIEFSNKFKNHTNMDIVNDIRKRINTNWMTDLK